MSSRKSVIQFYKINQYFKEFDSDFKIIDQNCNDIDNCKLQKVDIHKQFRRGEKAYEAGHVRDFSFESTLLILKGTVRASMKSQNYKPYAYLNENFTIQDARCDCTRGVACHHIAALLNSAHYNVSVTDIQCTWKSKPTDERNDGVSFKELFPQNECYSAINGPVDIKLAYDTIAECGRGCAGFAWLMQPESEKFCDIDKPTSLRIPNIQDVISSDEFVGESDKFNFLLSKLRLQPTEIVNIAKATIGQISNPLWCEARQSRFSGSIVGSIIQAVSNNRKLAPSLVRTISSKAMLRPAITCTMKKGKYSLRINPRQWGQDHEKDAKEKFCEMMSLAVEETGVWIHESGFWCASPDGLVGEDAVLEIKCPFQYRSEKSLKDCLDEEIFYKTAPSKRYAIYYEKDLGEFFMWKEHQYYHQIQSEMWCAFRNLCYFVVWIPEDVVVVVVQRDDQWYLHNLPKLENAYQEQFLPLLMGIGISNESSVLQ